MRRILGWCAAGLLIGSLSGAASAAGSKSFVLESADITAGKKVPETFVDNTGGCKGGNQSPALRWHGAPAGTKSFVITLFDPDEKSTGSGWWHWVLYDVPATTQEIPRGAGVSGGALLPAAAKQGRNDMSEAFYEGPCPDAGGPPHRYVFTIYALSVATLAVPAEATGANVASTARGLALARATLVPFYVH